jgi:hypothetical protein
MRDHRSLGILKPNGSLRTKMRAKVATQKLFFYPSWCPPEPNDDLNLGLFGVAADSPRFLPRSFGGLHGPICLRWSNPVGPIKWDRRETSSPHARPHSTSPLTLALRRRHHHLHGPPSRKTVQGMTTMRGLASRRLRWRHSRSRY